MIAHLVKKPRLFFFFKSNVRVVYKQNCKNVKHMFFQIKLFLNSIIFPKAVLKGSLLQQVHLAPSMNVRKKFCLHKQIAQLKTNFLEMATTFVYAGMFHVHLLDFTLAYHKAF